MAAKLEVERKYEVPVGFVVPDLTVVKGVGALAEPAEQHLNATYFDTEELRLIANRVTVRLRTGGKDAGWHVKRPAGHGDRVETQIPSKRGRRGVPRKIRDSVRDASGGAPLEPVARIRTRRLERALRDSKGRVLALLADDTVSATTPAPGSGTGAVVKRWRELEVELVDGPRSLLDAVDEALRGAGAVPASAPSKLARALADRNPGGSGQRSSDDGVLRRYASAQLEAITGNEAGVRVADPDAVHDMRVATRRLRSTFRTFRPLLDRSRTEPLRDELHWLADLLGDVRDGDVMAGRLARAVAAEPPELVLGPVAARIKSRLYAQTAEARNKLVEGLDGSRYRDLLDALRRVIAELPADVRPKRLRRLARKALRRADRRLATAGAAGKGERDSRLHAARRAYKRARYAAETLEPTAGKPAHRLGKRLSALQDVLGTHQDTIVTGRLLRDYGVRAHLDGDNAFTYGLLHARQREAGARVLDGLGRARRRAGKAKVRDWLDD